MMLIIKSLVFSFLLRNGTCAVIMEFEQEVYTVMEDAGFVQACVTARGEGTSNSDTGELRITFYTENDTAYAGRDYTHTEIDTVISERLCIDIPIINNYLPGSDVQFSLKATSTSLTTPVAPSVVVITDDDVPRGCTYEVLNATLAEERAREEVVMEIVGVLGMSNMTSASLVDILHSASNKVTNEPPMRTAYKAVAKIFGLPVTDEGYKNFTVAVGQLTKAKMAVCEVDGAISEEDIPRLSIEYRAMRENIEANIEGIRDIFGKMLCLSERTHSIKRKRQDFHCPDRMDCTCPDTGELVCVCEFFACLDPDDDIRPITGIFDINVLEGFPCLAFTVDTTGSMRQEINSVKEVVRSFINSEEDGPGCYVLQPFNDYVHGTFDPTSIPDATVATTYNGLTSINELEAFLTATDSMYAHDGGDRPETQLRAMLKTLSVEYDYGFGNYSVMTPGSEIVLLTDAPSHNPDLEDYVIAIASAQKVCINFYLSGPYAASFQPYHRIAAATGGTVVNSIDRSSFLNFTSEHDYGQCARFYGLPTFEKRKKRAVSSSSYDTEQRCHYFTTSLLTDTLTVQGYTSQDTMIVTKPDAEEVRVIPNFRGDKLYHDTAPQSGQWSVCVENGTLTITLDIMDSISSILQYLTPLSELSLNHSVPPACMERILTLETAQIEDIDSMSIQLLSDESGEVLTTAPLYRCANRLLGSVLFPQARVTYRAVGSDVNGRPFSASLSRTDTFVQTVEVKFQLLMEGDNPIDVDHGQTISLNLTINNHDITDTHYTFTADPVTGFRQAFHPTSLVVPPGGSGSVNMIILQIGAEPGSSYTFTANATDGCAILSASKTVTIQMPGNIV